MQDLLGGASVTYSELLSACVQVALLQRRCRQRGWGGLEALTVDKYQGRDKAAIIISLV